MVCNSFYNCQVSTFGRVIQLAKVHLGVVWLICTRRQVNFGGGYVWTVTLAMLYVGDINLVLTKFFCMLRDRAHYKE